MKADENGKLPYRNIGHAIMKVLIIVIHGLKIDVKKRRFQRIIFWFNDILYQIGPTRNVDFNL